jgi:K+-transporting ATPase KdpF subunit
VRVPFRTRYGLLSIRSAVMIALAGLLAAALFVYLFYALIKPERF